MKTKIKWLLTGSNGESEEVICGMLGISYKSRAFLRLSRPSHLLVILLYSFLLCNKFGTLSDSSKSRDFRKKDEYHNENLIHKNDDVLELLKASFKAADTTKDGKLSVKEIYWAIGRKVRLHIQIALKGNMRSFFSLDKLVSNGQVDWNEYYEAYFINMNSSRSSKEKLAASKASWAEAAKSNPEALNIDEFLSFTHPEYSRSSILMASEELLNAHDENGDEKLSKEEYNNHKYKDLSQTEKERRAQDFSEFMDENRDGFVTKKELILYFDPKSPHWSLLEAQRLLEVSDDDQNRLIDKYELLAHSKEFMNSKFFNPEQIFHQNINL